MDEQEKIVARGDAETVKRESARRTRRSFLVGGAVAAAGYGVSQWIADSKPVGRLQSGLRLWLVRCLTSAGWRPRIP